MRHPWSACLATLALAATLATPAAAQVPDTLPCPDCNPPKRFWAGAGELMAVQLIPLSVNRILRDAEWADISPSSWADNIKFPWQWDNNKFLNNQFSHPYHGNLYFNAARTNGYNFWESAPWAWAGSLMWELFGEVWAPAPNDLLNTSLGGITLGETTYRLSSLILDNTATGSERVFREIGATLVNPVRGFNRLVRGEMNDVSANPADWRPSRIFGGIEMGYRNFSDNTSHEGDDALHQGFLHFALIYGDPVADLDGKPFSNFDATGLISSNSAEGKALGELRVRGSLGATQLGDTPDRSMLAAFMSYTFISNPVVEFGAQGFQGGLVVGSSEESSPRLRGEALLAGYPIAAIRSDYFTTAEGRDYDYGVALGTQLRGSAAWGGKFAVRGSFGYTLLPVLSGFSGDHNLFVAGADARYYLGGRLGAGAAFQQLWRRSNYGDLPNVEQDASEFRLFLTYAVPRWQP